MCELQRGLWEQWQRAVFCEDREWNDGRVVCAVEPGQAERYVRLQRANGRRFAAAVPVLAAAVSAVSAAAAIVGEGGQEGVESRTRGLVDGTSSTNTHIYY